MQPVTTRYLYFLLVILTYLLVSCQREVEDVLPGRASDNAGLLKQKVYENRDPASPNDAQFDTTDYTYNVDKRLVATEYRSHIGQRTRISRVKYLYDNQGRVTSVGYPKLIRLGCMGNPDVLEPVFDTSFFRIIYENETSSRIKYRKYYGRQGIQTTEDSTVFEYDANDHVRKITRFGFGLAVHQPTDSFSRLDYFIWTYDATGLLKSSQSFSLLDSNGVIIPYDWNAYYEYDNNPSPLDFDISVSLIVSGYYALQYSVMPVHNLIKLTMVQVQSGQQWTETANYTYRPDNKPAVATYSSTPPSRICKTSFYYY